VAAFGSSQPQRSFSIEFKAVSDGEKCFFLSTHIIASNMVGPPVVCMWDEPDNPLSLSEVWTRKQADRPMAA
jgi:hypothetical protein